MSNPALRTATFARLCTVWCWNRSRGVMRIPACRARLTTWIEMIESPPSSKKLSSMPTRSSLSTSCQIAANSVCSSSIGAV
ncbi:hypothetical protein D3C78_1020760 [compost metagenome]